MPNPLRENKVALPATRCCAQGKHRRESNVQQPTPNNQRPRKALQYAIEEKVAGCSWNSPTWMLGVGCWLLGVEMDSEQSIDMETLNRFLNRQ